VDGIAGTLAAALSWKLAGIVVKGRARAGQGPVVMGAA
jgi:hypothetical protein